MTPEQRRGRARVAVHASWANTADRAARTTGTKTFLDRSARQVDPDGALPEDIRAAMGSARKDRVNAAVGWAFRGGPTSPG